MSKYPMFVTCTAPVNMAVIKYWGKTDEINIIPANSSISATLSQDTMRSTTTAMASKDFTQDRLWLDGKYVRVCSLTVVRTGWELGAATQEWCSSLTSMVGGAGGSREEEITDRMRRCFAKLREHARDVERDGMVIKKDEWPQYHFHICSKNNFPTAAGLASSASGFACLGTRVPPASVSVEG